MATDQENQVNLFSSETLQEFDGLGYLEHLKHAVSSCARCDLHNQRTHVVFGEGNHYNPAICFVGEGPGKLEDEQGHPFVGRAGQLLDKMISAMGLKREDLYITNTVACRPPNNRTPTAQELMSCYPYLRGQIFAIKPKCLVTLGATATTTLLHLSQPLHASRGRWYTFHGIPVRATYHPAFLLRGNGQAYKSEAWKDLQSVTKLLDELAKR